MINGSPEVRLFQSKHNQPVVILLYSHTVSKWDTGFTSIPMRNWTMKSIVISESPSRWRKKSRRNLFRNFGENFMVFHWNSLGHMDFLTNY